MKLRTGLVFSACLALTVTGLLAAPQAQARDIAEAAVLAPDVRVASYNVKGWHLTVGGFDGRVRMRESLNRIEAKGIGIVGLQEFESPQAEVVRNDGTWDLYRADANSVFPGGNYGGNAIMWKDHAWDLMSSFQLHAKVGNRRELHMPIVVLKNTSNGERVAVMNVHNPSGADAADWRAALRQLEREKIRDLKANHDHVLLLGDFNENEAAACFFTTNEVMKAATGYKANANGSCPVSGYPGVDWIFGAGQIGFAGWEVDRTFEERNWSDHPLVSAYYTYN